MSARQWLVFAAVVAAVAVMIGEWTPERQARATRSGESWEIRRMGDRDGCTLWRHSDRFQHTYFLTCECKGQVLP